MSRPLPPPRQFYLGVDLGKLRDFSAISIIERYSTRAGRDPVWVCDIYRWTNTLRRSRAPPPRHVLPDGHRAHPRRWSSPPPPSAPSPWSSTPPASVSR